MDSKLRAAFRWHLQNMPRHRHSFGDGLADARREVSYLSATKASITRGFAEMKRRCGYSGKES